MTVKYYYHSGFSVASGETLLVFDYWMGRQGKKLPAAQRITPETLSHFSEVFVFISHGHEDHFDPVVYTWEQYAPVTYILPETMDASLHGRRMGVGGEITLSRHVKVKAFDSTDEGLSYLVEMDGIRIFHAGDLNNWHWDQENTEREIHKAREEFTVIVDRIAAACPAVDVAFFPVDTRLGANCTAGAEQFLTAVKTADFFPMHFKGSYETACDFAAYRLPDAVRARTAMHCLHKPGESVEI